MNIKLYAMLVFFFRPFHRQFFTLLAIVIIFTISESVSLAVAFPLMSMLLGTDAFGSGGRLLKYLSDWIVNIHPGDPMGFTIFFFFLMMGLTGLFNYLREYYSFSVAQRIRSYYGGMVFDKFIKSDFEYMIEQKQGVIVHNILAAPSQMSTIFFRAPVFFGNLLKLAAIFFVLLTISVPVTIGMTVIGMLFQWSVHAISQKVTLRLAREMVRADENATVVVNEALTGFQQVKIYQGESHWVGRLVEHLRIFEHAHSTSMFYQEMGAFAAKFGVLAAGCGVFLILHVWFPRELTEFLPIFGIFFLAMVRVFPALQMIAADWLTIHGRLPFAESVYRALHEENRRMICGEEALPRGDGVIRFHAVSYRYRSREAMAVEALDFVIEPLQMTALVGESGCGKSTVANLLLGLMVPTAGTIFVDEVPLSRIAPHAWLNHVGLVSQDTFLFHGTIRENILFGHACSEADMEEAARQANAHEFIVDFPKGYDTVVGDRGLMLSGGQRQRLAIARAILRKPRLLVMDEATSALDSASEAAVWDAVRRLTRNYTVVVIAHRLATIQEADHIIVLKEGRVAATGKHDTLLADQGEYARLYRKIQSR
ncbi:MAG: ABC transporter ATP-binding protein [Magnetococcales bacterium]|nr:ABC transporter ATP-binding protein [Magnetococcales bacterium]MBF0322821.1 ABC transporter ATP-binding protein [Magnetococcales bacterium]